MRGPLPRIAFAGLAAALAVALACGYRFAGAPHLPSEARSVHVPVFRNQTAEPGVEAWFTEALREQFARAGLEGGEASDLTAVGEIVEVSPPLVAVQNLPPSDAGVSSIAAPQVSLYRVQATAVVRLLRGGKEVAKTRVTGAEEYQPGLKRIGLPEELPHLSEADKRLALRRLAGTLMRRAYENLTLIR